ncbi:MAG: hypothetical protein HQ588_05670 [Deltaproteobacteria bacterium]|nr:hypothetical protein [Deltaproteobacteria bacterium]
MLEIRKTAVSFNEKEALRFLKKHLNKKVQEGISGKGHCKPWFELPGRSAGLPPEKVFLF